MQPATITDLANWNPPQRMRQDDDGETIVEKLSPLPGVLAIDPAGNLMVIPTSNGIANRAVNDPYRIQILAEKQAKGWILVGRCPLGSAEAHAHLPKVVRFNLRDGKPDEKSPKSPCQQGAAGGKITAVNPCKCIAALIEARAEKHNKKQAVAEERTNRLAKIAENTALASQAAAQQLAKAAEAMATAAGAKKDGK